MWGRKCACVCSRRAYLLKEGYANKLEEANLALRDVLIGDTIEQRPNRHAHRRLLVTQRPELLGNPHRPFPMQHIALGRVIEIGKLDGARHDHTWIDVIVVKGRLPCWKDKTMIGAVK